MSFLLPFLLPFSLSFLVFPDKTDHQARLPLSSSAAVLAINRLTPACPSIASRCPGDQSLIT
ncbi:MAG: hypothetical protein K6U11_14555 [bacterium]|nr:hypothetical protein [bacterium]